MTLQEIEDTVTRWHIALYRDLIMGRIVPVQLMAGIEAANHWAVEQHASIFTPEQESDLCPTTIF